MGSSIWSYTVRYFISLKKHFKVESESGWLTLLVRPYIQNRFGVVVKMQMYLLLESESW